jgi:hypothetical protein
MAFFGRSSPGLGGFLEDDSRVGQGDEETGKREKME